MSDRSVWWQGSKYLYYWPEIKCEYTAYVAYGDTHNPGKFIVMPRIVQISRSFEYDGTMSRGET